MHVVSEENFPPLQEHIKIVEVEMDGAAIYRREAEIRLLYFKMDLASQKQCTPFALNPVRGLATQVAQDNNNMHIYTLKCIICFGIYCL